MSGGHFDYDQYRISAIADSIDQAILTNGQADEWGYARNYSEETLEKFRAAAYTLARAAVMAQRVDYLLSGDDGEESFHERWEKEVRPQYKRDLQSSEPVI